MYLINSIRHFFERNGFNVLSRFADKLGMRAKNVRLFFVYIFFASAGFTFGLSLTFARKDVQ